MSKRIIVGVMLAFLVVNSLLGMAFGWWAFVAGVTFIAFVTMGITVILKMVNGGKPSKGVMVTTVLSLLLSICFLLLGISGAKKKIEASRHGDGGTGVVVIVKYLSNPSYDMYWEIVSGPSFHGRHKVPDDERKVEKLNAGDANRFDMDQHYLEDGKPQVMRFRGQKVSEGRWEGSWDQDKPKAKGQFFVNEDGTNSFTGGMTFEWGENKSAATLVFKPVE